MPPVNRRVFTTNSQILLVLAKNNLENNVATIKNRLAIKGDSAVKTKKILATISKNMF